MSNFATRFKMLRQEKKLTQQQIADKFFINKSSISRYERGQQMPEIELLKKFAMFFDVSVDYLLGESDSTTEIPEVEKSKVPNTIAAHFDGDGDFTEEELNQIERFIEFVRKAKEEENK